jgi:lycopene beta-cyclase
MKHYEFIMAGGGLGGLSLALHIAHSPLRDHSMLIVDQQAKERNDRTWCFWAETPSMFDEIVFRSWKRIHFAGENFERVVDLGTYDYRMLRGIDFYRFAWAKLSAYPNVELLQGRVDRVEDGDGSARVTIGGHMVSGDWVFDSRFKPAQFNPDPARYHYLQQHFQGWLIETLDQPLDPQTVTFLDFRTPQKNEMRFFYVLPFSERRALVEYVTLSRDDYDQALKTYLETALGIKDYRILGREAGISPLTDYPFPRRMGRHVMTIGTPAGRIKPSSGYAFTRIQKDSAAIVQSLLRASHPFDVPDDPGLYRLCDALMLEVMSRHGQDIKPIFSTMFKNNPIQRIFRFLDETTSAWENLLLIASMPPGPFLQAWFRVKVLGGLNARRRNPCFRVNQL